MKLKWWLVAAGVLIAGVFLAVSAYNLSSPPMNVLLITLDTTRADHLGCYGYDKAETPRLDALAKHGVLFERAYAPAPMTSPSHTSMMTGLWPPEHGVYTNAEVTLDPKIPTIAETLSRRGYFTAGFPAASMLAAKFGLNRGFQRYFDDLSNTESGADHFHRSRDGQVNADIAIGWLQSHFQQSSSAPFFCWVHFYDPHDPYLPHPEEFGEKFKDRPYDGDIAYVDRQIGRLLDALERLGATKNTVIVVVGDHGESLGEHGEEMHGYMLHESTLRVPLIVADPRRAAGRRVATPVSLVDLYPTILEFSGAQVPSEMKRRSLQPALAGKPLQPRFCYSQTVEPYLLAFWSPMQGITTERWRYVRTTKPELYDLASDPNELVNLADQQLDKVNELDGELAAFEEKFQRRTGAHVTISAQERHALESLGYTGGTSAKEDPRNAQNRPDIKEMIGYLNQFHRASHLIDERNFTDAAVLLEPLARDVPNFPRARLNLAQCRMRLQNYEEAVHWCKSALEIDAKSDRAYEIMGYSYLKMGQLDLAEQSFLRLIELHPDSESGHLYLGEVHQRRGNLPLAREQYQTVLRINPTNQLAHRVLKALVEAAGKP